MKTIVISRPGGPEVLEYTERAIPPYGDDDVLIKVAAAGINRPDIFQRKGHYPPPSWAPQDIPGLEVAGTIAALGTRVQKFKIGDRVCALLAGGGYAAYAVAPEGLCLSIPQKLSFAEAASLPETFFTVWSNVFDRGRLMENETLMIHGGSSGIGVTAIQMAKAHNAQVWVTAGSEEKCEFCRELGADMAINYKLHDFKDAIRAMHGKAGADVILDMVGGDYTQRNLDILNEEGRLVLINHMEGDVTSIHLNVVMRKRLTITGSTLRSRDNQFKATVARSLEQRIWPFLASGEIRPVIDKTFPLEDAADAHRYMERGNHIGKIVLIVHD